MRADAPGLQNWPNRSAFRLGYRVHAFGRQVGYIDWLSNTGGGCLIRPHKPTIGNLITTCGLGLNAGPN